MNSENRGDSYSPYGCRGNYAYGDDDLSIWLKSSNIPTLRQTERVIQCWKDIQAKDPLHKLLVDNIKQRSLADPWVIAHAIDEGACVVTKENKETAHSTTRIKIPNVCENMGVPWIDDFQFIRELNMRFYCKLVNWPCLAIVNQMHAT